MKLNFQTMLQFQYENDKLTIAALKKQLTQYKQEAHFWKSKYETLQNDYNQLLQSLKTKNLLDPNQCNLAEKQEIAFFDINNRKLSEVSLQFHDDDFNMFLKPAFQTNEPKEEMQINKLQSHETIPSQKQEKSLFPKKFGFGSIETPVLTQPDEQFSPGRSPRMKQDQIDFFSIEQIQKHSSYEENVTFGLKPVEKSPKSTSKGFDLIQGYFILEKIENFRQHTKKYDLWIKAANQTLKDKQKNLLEIVYRYTFRQQPLVRVQDDPFDSRVNQIKYGTPYEELIYSFDNYQPNEQEDSKFISKSIRKKYVHCLIRPELVTIDGKQFETQIMYGFISPFPFRNFFIDIHRTLQQQIKFEIINSNKNIPEEVQVSKDLRISTLSKLMGNLFEHCLLNYSNIDNYPIKINIETKVSNIILEIETQDEMRKMQRQSLQILMKKYNLLKVSKILHYMMTEKQIILVSTTRKNLNEVFQMVRLIIKPFYWVFPIVYRYSDHFQPFLSSPLPLMLGIVFDFNNKNYKDNKILMENEFVTIFVEQIIVQKETFFFFSSNKPKYTPTDLRQSPVYEKDIQFLFKYLTKVDKKSRSNESQRIQKYVNKLRYFIQTGKADSQLTSFMIEFMDTQMVQCFKQILNGSNKKISSENDYNEEMAMTR